jgi:uncharacterized protein YjiS (DUF1127 family)
MMAKSWRKPCAGCNAALPRLRLVLHLQQDYLAVRGGTCPPTVQIMKRTTAMAATETTRPAPFGAITTFRAITAVSAILAGFSAWNDARMTRRALDKLSDRELDDIGLCRGDLDRLGR